MLSFRLDLVSAPQQEGSHLRAAAYSPPVTFTSECYLNHLDILASSLSFFKAAIRFCPASDGSIQYDVSVKLSTTALLHNGHQSPASPKESLSNVESDYFLADSELKDHLSKTRTGHASLDNHIRG